VDLLNVVVNDGTLGIVDHPVGTIAVGDPAVVISAGDIQGLLTKQDRCDSRGEKGNVAMATGFSAVGTKDEETDSATVLCVGQPAIKIVKKVSVHGVIFDDDTVYADPTSDAYYLIEVTNTGSEPLVDVKVSDEDLGLVDIVPVGTGGAGMLDVGETVVLVHSGIGLNTVSDLFVQDFCTTDQVFAFVNTATVEGKADDGGQTVNDDDIAEYICEPLLTLCDVGRPNILNIRYNGDGTDSPSDNAQTADTIVPNPVNLPPVVDVKIYAKNTGGFLKGYNDVGIGDPMFVQDKSKSGKIPPSVVIEILNAAGTQVLQTITFHGSCSQPLNVGDKFGGITIVGGIF